jgi:hypothetical protein
MVVVICRGAQVVSVLVRCLDGNQRWTSAAKVREVLFVEKKKERPMEPCSRTWKLAVPWVRLEIVFYSFFFYSLRVEILA